MRKMAFVAIVSFLALTTSATAQHPHVICAREVGVQLNSRGQSITQTWHFRTSDAYGRCMDRYRRGRTTSAAAAPGAAAHAGVQQTEPCKRVQRLNWRLNRSARLQSPRKL